MNTIELKHTLREKIQVATAITAVWFVAHLAQLHSKVAVWQIVLMDLGLWLFIWVLMSHQVVRVDDEGFTYRRFILTKRVKWKDITVVEADWSTHFEGLASSYGVNAFMGYLKFRGAGGKVLLKAKVNCGSVEVRRSIQEFMSHKLGNRLISPGAA